MNYQGKNKGFCEIFVFTAVYLKSSHL